MCSDASDYACGGCVSQEHDGKLCPVAYCSRAFKGPELKYTVQEKECLGVIYCLKKFTQYITYCPAFQIRLMTDHYSLQFLHNQKLIATGRMARWAMELAEHNAKIYYVKGRTNYTGDCLSRLLDLSETEFDTTQNLMTLYPRFQLMIQTLLTHRPSVEGISSKIDEEKYLSFWIKKASEFDKKHDNFDISCKTNSTRSDGNAPHECVLFNTARVSIKTKPLSITHEMYLKCHDFGVIYQCLHEKYKDTVSKENFKKVKHRLKDFFLENQLLYHITYEGEVLCIPYQKPCDCTKNGSIRNTVISELHDSDISGHRGISATYLTVRRRYYWPKLSIDVKNYIKVCEICNTTKSDRRKKSGLLQPLQAASRPRTHYAMDFKTHLPKSGRDGYDNLLVVVDRFSKMVFLIPTFMTASAEFVAEQFFERIVRTRGLMLEIVSDRDPKFTCNFWRTIWKKTGTHLKLSTARHQSTDGQSENAIKIVEEILRGKLNYKQDNWVKELSAVEFALNNSVSSATSLTPFVLESGWDPIVPLDLTTVSGSQHTTHDSNAHTFVHNIHALHTQARDCIALAQANMARFADERRRVGDELKVGGQCYLKLEGIDFEIFKKRPSKKLGPVYYGPFEILKKISPVSYQILLPHKSSVHDVFHIDRLKLHSDQTPGLVKGRSRTLPSLLDQEYEVDCIIDERLRYGKIEYLVNVVDSRKYPTIKQNPWW